MSGASSGAITAISLLQQAGRGAELPALESMPMPDWRHRLPMRDGIRLDTNVWLPRGRGPVPAILLRTPYRESTVGWKRLGLLRYVEAGYAVVVQTVRGTGASEGRFVFNAPHERHDGHDTVEWVAAQHWCSGEVGMDGSSYAAMMQLAAAAARPPHLRCIVPAVPLVDFFREVPYCGGVFSRQHTLHWSRLLQVDTLAALRSGFLDTLPVLAQPDVLARLTMRPALHAADDWLEGDLLQHYRDVLEHPRLDDWWRMRMMSGEDYARIDVPALVVSGSFDLGIGPLTLWRGLEAHASNPSERQLLIGPWDHGQCYVGGAASHGPYEMGEQSVLDLVALRLVFFDRHLKEKGAGPLLRDRVTLFVTGANEWRGFDTFPPPEVSSRVLYLHSSGRANTHRGDGRLGPEAPMSDESPDRFTDDPALPFVPALAAAHEPAWNLDLRERERHGETLVYDSGALTDALTLLGEGVAEPHVSADAPDADLFVWLAEHRVDGLTVKLATGQLRLRYRDGFHTEQPLVPGAPVKVRLPLTYVAHRIPAGSRLRLLVGGSNFPWADPNAHDGGPVAAATSMHPAVQAVFHDVMRPSRLLLPLLV